MITTIIALLLLLVGSMFNLTYIKDFMPTIIAVTCVALIITFVFWLTNFIIFKTPKLDRYEKNWDEPILVISRFLYSALVCALILKILWNCKNGTSYLENTLLLWGILLVADVANVFIIFNVYSFDVKGSILDSIMVQINGVRNGLLMLITFVAILKFTIVGFLILVMIVGIFISLFKL